MYNTIGLNKDNIINLIKLGQEFFRVSDLSEEYKQMSFILKNLASEHSTIPSHNSFIFRIISTINCNPSCDTFWIL